jgi:hypothetical protein
LIGHGREQWAIALGEYTETAGKVQEGSDNKMFLYAAIIAAPADSSAGCLVIFGFQPNGSGDLAVFQL